MIVLGYHGGLDALFARTGTGGAAAIVVDGRVVAACEDAQFARATRTGAVPEPAIGYVLAKAGLQSLREVDLVAFACSGERAHPRDVLARHDHGLGRSHRVGLALASGAWRVIDRLGGGGAARFRRALASRTGVELEEDRVVAIEDHCAHLAGAFFGSGTARALCVATGSRSDIALAAAVGRGTRVEEIERTTVPDSLVHLRAIVASHLGLTGDPVAMSALAASGDPAVHRRFFRSIVRVRRGAIAEVDGELVLEAMARAAIGASATPALVEALGPARRPDAPLTQAHADIAAALEDAIEIAVLTSLHTLRERTGETTLCWSGELALDPALNGRIARSGLFARVHVPAAPTGAGAAIGAALHAYHHMLGHGREMHAIDTDYLGPEADDALVTRATAIFATEVDAEQPDDLPHQVAAAIASGEVVAWVQGRAACAASTLGSRSLLADPRDPAIAERVHAVMGNVARHHPFTALVPVERAAELFDLDGIGASPHGLYELPLRAERRGELRGLEGPGGRVRLLTVAPETSPRLHALLHAFAERTGLPVLLEAELRAGGAPVAHGPEDAIEALLGSSIDRLVLGDRVVQRRAAPRDERIAA